MVITNKTDIFDKEETKNLIDALKDIGVEIFDDGSIYGDITMDEETITIEYDGLIELDIGKIFKLFVDDFLSKMEELRCENSNGNHN